MLVVSVLPVSADPTWRMLPHNDENIVIVLVGLHVHWLYQREVIEC